MYENIWREKEPEGLFTCQNSSIYKRLQIIFKETLYKVFQSELQSVQTKICYRSRGSHSGVTAEMKNSVSLH